MIVPHKRMWSNGIGSERLDAPHLHHVEATESALPLNQSMLDNCFDGETRSTRVVNDGDASSPRAVGRTLAVAFHGEGFDADRANVQLSAAGFDGGNRLAVQVCHDIRVGRPTFWTGIHGMGLLPARPTGGDEEEEQQDRPWFYVFPHSGGILPKVGCGAKCEIPLHPVCDPAVYVCTNVNSRIAKREWFSTLLPLLLGVGRRRR
jgi:hypothetical protein